LRDRAATSSGLDSAIDEAASWLAERQSAEGYWVGMLQSNCCMEAQWILAMHVLGVVDDPKTPGIVRAILDQQRPDGSWDVYFDAPAGDINTTVECYTALRCTGLSPTHPALATAREWIFSRGGLRRVRVFTRYWLALLGEWPWEATPTVPPELIFLPSWCPMNIYRFASWARATLLPIAVLAARRPQRRLPPGRRLDELFPAGRQHEDYRLPRPARRFSVEGAFHLADRLLQAYGRLPYRPGRETAIQLALQWIIKHQEADGAWSGIQPPWIYSLMALHNEGYPLDHPVLAAGLRAWDAHWSYERDGATHLQASESPVWDTLLTLEALLDCELAEGCRQEILRAVEWLLGQQSTVPGDWSVNAPGVEPGGWAFERANRLYPDVDDTAVAVLVLSRLRDKEPAGSAAASRLREAIDKAVDWMIALQCRNGGWAAFDRDNTSALVTKIPFCDFGEVLDPPSVDVTAHVVEALVAAGRTLHDPVVARAVAYIRDEQEADGSWFGRWGVNHIYGTGAVLPALAAVGEDMSADYIRRAAEWIVEHQNEDGGWGESCASYMDRDQRGVGPSTASQTAWALIGLLATDDQGYGQPVRRGVDFLVSRQRGGTWDEPQYTGTGFPGYGLGRQAKVAQGPSTIDQGTELARAFMINYNLYRHYFPMMALGRARRYLAGASSTS
jgi:squalene-hopene/tetraprenyl-beta-curcumene cyclase